jgi:RimJ/RimL family protein N-acetyltransferase
MTPRLVPLVQSGDVEALAAALAPGFGGDAAPVRDFLEQTFGLLRTQPRAAPWGAYLAYEGEVAVGSCAFKAAPDSSGSVEIAYFTFPAFEGRGHATAMAGALFDIARGGGASTVVAHTLPEENASTRALRRNGFVFAGETEDPEDGTVWRWERACG